MRKLQQPSICLHDVLSTGGPAAPSTGCACLLPSCAGPSAEQRWVYTLRLQLEDATGQLDAFLFGPDGEVALLRLPAGAVGMQATAPQLLALHFCNVHC